MKESKNESNKCKKIRKGDKVVAIAGNYRGMSGEVLSCRGEKVIVQGINVRKKHMKGTRTQPGQILQIERPIHVSNVKLCNDAGQPIKVKVRSNAQGERELYYQDGKNEVLYRVVKKPAK